jgi:hypothetical protein
MHGIDIADAVYSGYYSCLACLAPAAAQGWATPKAHQLVNTISTQLTMPYLPLPPLQSLLGYQQNLMCFFCGGPHIMRACTVTGEYLRAGRII